MSRRSSPVTWDDLKTLKSVFDSFNTSKVKSTFLDFGFNTDLTRLLFKGQKFTKTLTNKFTIQNAQSMHELGMYMKNFTLKTRFQKLCAFYVTRFKIPLEERRTFTHIFGERHPLSAKTISASFLMLVFNILLRIYNDVDVHKTQDFEKVTELIGYFFPPPGTKSPKLLIRDDATRALVEDFAIFEKGLTFETLLNWETIRLLALPKAGQKIALRYHDAPGFVPPVDNSIDPINPYMILSLLATENENDSRDVKFFRHLAATSKNSTYTPKVFGTKRSISHAVVRLLLAFYENDKINLGDDPNEIAEIVKNGVVKTENPVGKILWAAFSAWKSEKKPAWPVTTKPTPPLIIGVPEAFKAKLAHLQTLSPIYQWEIEKIKEWAAINNTYLTPTQLKRVSVEGRTNKDWVDSFKIGSKNESRLSTVAILHPPIELTNNLLRLVEGDLANAYDLYKVNRFVELNNVTNLLFELGNPYLRAIETRDLSTKISFVVKQLTGK